MNLKNLSSSEDGFSLIEVLAASGLLGISVYAAMRLMSLESNFAAIERSQTVATQIAASVIEDLLNRYSSDPALDPTLPPQNNITTLCFDTDGKPLGHPPFPSVNCNPGTYFTVRWTVSDNATVSGVINIKEVVQWKIAGSIINHSVGLNVSRPGN